MEAVDHPDAQLQPLNKWPKSQLLPNSRLRSTPRHKQVCPNLPRGQPRPLVEEVAGKVHHITQPHPLLEGLVSIVHLVIHCAQVYQAMTETRVFQKNEQWSVFLLFKKINLLCNSSLLPLLPSKKNIQKNCNSNVSNIMAVIIILQQLSFLLSIWIYHWLFLINMCLWFCIELSLKYKYFSKW